VTNIGGAHLAAADVVVTDDLSDVLDDATYVADADSAGAGILVWSSPVLTWSGDLAVDAVVTVTYSVTVNDGDELGDGVLVNAVTGGECPEPAVTDPEDPAFDADCVVRDAVASGSLPDTAVGWLLGETPLLPIGGLGGVILAGTALTLAAGRRRRSGRASRRPEVG
jgi:hypothetical protein